MTVINKIGSLVIIIGSVLFLSACDGSKPFKDLQAFLEKLKQEDVKPDADKSKLVNNEVEPVSTQYVSDKLRSPFEIFEAAPSKGKATSNPLQAYPLDMLRFVGTVTQNNSTIAFISAPDNKIYQIKAGDIIGDRDSEVVKIESDKISLMEPTSEGGSAALKRVVTLQLKDISQ